MRFVGVIIVLLFMSCSTKQESDILPRNKMIDILADIHKTDALMMYSVNRNRVKVKDVKYYYVGLFKKYHITKEQFDASYRYYSKNMSDFEKLYNEVIIKLTKQQDSLNFYRNSPGKEKKKS